jgi:hypothetical protein
MLTVGGDRRQAAAFGLATDPADCGADCAPSV